MGPQFFTCTLKLSTKTLLGTTTNTIVGGSSRLPLKLKLFGIIVVITRIMDR